MQGEIIVCLVSKLFYINCTSRVIRFSVNFLLCHDIDKILSLNLYTGDMFLQISSYHAQYLNSLFFVTFPSRTIIIYAKYPLQINDNTISYYVYKLKNHNIMYICYSI